MIVYQETLENVTPAQLTGFFVGWPQPPSPETHYRLLEGSQHVVLARDTEPEQVVGFVTAISDGVLCAYIPLLEVLPAYQGRGIGSALVRRLLAQLEGLYMIDLLCDAEVQPFYERLGLRPATGMMRRDYATLQGET